MKLSDLPQYSGNKYDSFVFIGNNYDEDSLVTYQLRAGDLISGILGSLEDVESMYYDNTSMLAVFNDDLYTLPFSAVSGGGGGIAGSRLFYNIMEYTEHFPIDQLSAHSGYELDYLKIPVYFDGYIPGYPGGYCRVGFYSKFESFMQLGVETSVPGLDSNISVDDLVSGHGQYDFVIYNNSTTSQGDDPGTYRINARFYTNACIFDYIRSATHLLPGTEPASDISFVFYTTNHANSNLHYMTLLELASYIQNL